MARSRRFASRSRREFLKQSLAVAGGAAAALPLDGAARTAHAEADTAHASALVTPTPAPNSTLASPETMAGDEASLATTIAYPRVFTGRQLAMIAFPLGGLGAGSISLGGRGQLRDWEIFNRPDKGNAPNYAFPAIWAQRGTDPPVARVLEARLQPPYEGSSGLGARSAPGLQRLETATFTGEYPLAHVAFADPHLPVAVTLDAFSPFIPHEEDDSGLPAAILRYRVTNGGNEPVRVSIAWAIENMVNAARPRPAGGAQAPDTRTNDLRRADRIEGLLLHNPALDPDDPMAGSFGLWLLDPTRNAAASGTPGANDASTTAAAANTAVAANTTAAANTAAAANTTVAANTTAAANAGDPVVSTLRGWPRERWWTSVLRYWDDFSQDGRLGPEAEKIGPVAALCLQRTVTPGAHADYTFLLTWHFPNRTPARCGWRAPKGEEETIIGNHYATRFDDAWSVARYVATQIDRLERTTRAFAQAMRETTLPGAIVDAATANLSTLATQTVFRTKDGAFHGFEGCNDKAGCCMGNCTHVWNYETSTAHLFPAMSRSLRRAAFGYSMDDDGAMRIRQLLPDGSERYAITAADGQMGQIIKAYLDWRLTGDAATLRDFWPLVKKAIAFAWLDGGWDADRDGVLEGVQHNTYDVEFYGPNPQCGIYYLGALRAAEEMAHAAGDREQAATYRALFTRGRDWIDEHLFNGEYYVQRVRGVPRDRVRATLRSDMGSDETLTPQYQVGDGCLVDQLVGQCLAEVAGLGPLIDPTHCRTALASIYRYNHRADLFDHGCLQRTYAVNDEAALLVCDYGKGTRPAVPFPYYAEVWTGLEYTAAAHMIYAGLTREGVTCVTNARLRHDGIRRNPWNEPECGHHYARAMSAWSCLLAASGFRYDGVTREVELLPRVDAAAAENAAHERDGAIAGAARGDFRAFWASGTGWGTFAYGDGERGRALTLRVLHGRLPCQSIVCLRGERFGPAGGDAAARAAGSPVGNPIGKDAVRVRYRDRLLPHAATTAEGRTRIRLRNDLTLTDGDTLVIDL